jgi:hypothetical protein
MAIPKLIAFITRLIPNKDSYNGFFIQFPSLVSRHMHVCFAAKHAKVRNIRNCAIVPEFIRSPPLQSAGRGAVVDVHRSINRKFPKAIRQTSSM